MERTPVALKIWLAGLAVIWLAAKFHFFATYNADYVEYFGRHWPFWVAMAAWGLLGVGLMRRDKARHVPPDPH